MRQNKSFSSGLFIVVFSIFCIFPVVWIFMMSLKNPVDAFSLPPKLIFLPVLKNFVDVFKNGFFMKTYFNSMLIAGGATFFSLLIGIPAAYVITRFRFRGYGTLTFWILVTRMAPASAMVVAFFTFLLRLNLIDKFAGLVMVYMTFNVGYVIWMMRGFIQSIPIEIEEAAIVDGCSRMKTLINIVLPLSGPGIATVSIMSFIFSWNEFLYALILTRSNWKTAPVSVLTYISSEGIRWGEISAASILIVLPILILSLAIQKYIISGLTMGAIK